MTQSAKTDTKSFKTKKLSNCYASFLVGNMYMGGLHYYYYVLAHLFNVFVSQA